MGSHGLGPVGHCLGKVVNSTSKQKAVTAVVIVALAAIAVGATFAIMHHQQIATFFSKIHTILAAPSSGIKIFRL